MAVSSQKGSAVTQGAEAETPSPVDSRKSQSVFAQLSDDQLFSRFDDHLYVHQGFSQGYAAAERFLLLQELVERKYLDNPKSDFPVDSHVTEESLQLQRAAVQQQRMVVHLLSENAPESGRDSRLVNELRLHRVRLVTQLYQLGRNEVKMAALQYPSAGRFGNQTSTSEDRSRDLLLRDYLVRSNQLLAADDSAVEPQKRRDVKAATIELGLRQLRTWYGPLVDITTQHKSSDLTVVCDQVLRSEAQQLESLIVRLSNNTYEIALTESCRAAVLRQTVQQHNLIAQELKVRNPFFAPAPLALRMGAGAAAAPGPMAIARKRHGF